MFFSQPDVTGIHFGRAVVPDVSTNDVTRAVVIDVLCCSWYEDNQGKSSLYVQNLEKYSQDPAGERVRL